MEILYKEEQESKSKKIPIIAIILFIFVALIIILVITVIIMIPNNSTNNSSLSNDTFIIFADCNNDHFQEVTYEKNNQNYSIKFRVITELDGHHQLTFETVKKKCEEFHSSLWEIKDEKEEWDSLFPLLKWMGLEMIWINAKIISYSCPEGSYTCFEDEAKEGRGLLVSYPSYPKSTYSRLYKGGSKNKQCISIEPGHDNLWKTSDCKREENYAVCIKRNCKPSYL